MIAQIDKKMQMVFMLLLFLLDVVVTRRQNDGANDDRYQSRRGFPEKTREKLLIIVIDGFRWDYLQSENRQTVNEKGKNVLRNPEYPGFSRFMSQGVHTEYITSVFPSESFPSWQTINTGRYPGTHGIIANQFFDQSQGSEYIRGFFDHMDRTSTKNVRWWETVEPIWVTAQKQGVKFSAFLWARCDVQWYDVKTYGMSKKDCEHYYEKDHSKTMKFNMEHALIKLQTVSDAAIVYEDSLGRAAMSHGPNSNYRKMELKKIDDAIIRLMDRLEETNMDSMVNVIITADHGITRRPAGDNQIEIGKELRNLGLVKDVSMLVGSGAYTMIHPKDDPQDTVLDAPTTNNDRHNRIVKKLSRELEGRADVYKKEDIPDHLHWKDNKNAPPILVLAKEGYVINPATGPERDLQQPRGRARARIRSHQRGISGYDPEYSDMRGAFMARGPGFNIKREAQPPIEIVDLYEMFCHLLNIIPAENDGLWDRIKGLLKNSSICHQPNSIVVLVVSFCALIWTNTV